MSASGKSWYVMQGVQSAFLLVAQRRCCAALLEALARTAERRSAPGLVRLAIGLGTAALSQLAGLSLALGASWPG